MTIEKLTPDQLRVVADGRLFGFNSSEELTPANTLYRTGACSCCIENGPGSAWSRVPCIDHWW